MKVYKAGVKSRPKPVTPSIPKSTAVPSDCRISAPAPVATTSGATPRMNENEVIRIGRRRVRAACTAASPEATPSSSFWRANSTIRIASLDGQADENNKADLCQDIDRHASYEQPCDRCEQAHRHDQDDRQRQLPVFVLRDQDQKHEESGCPEDENGGGATLSLLISKISPFKRDTPWKNLTSKLFHAMQCCAGSDTRRCDPCTSAAGKRL